jgi:para-nitrobenzyl esterase
MSTREMAAQTTDGVLKALDINPRDWRKLLDVPASELLRIQNNLPALPPSQRVSKPGGALEPRPGGFRPVVDGVALPGHPFDPTAPAISARKPLMVGWNEDEYTFFAWQSGDISAFGLDSAGLEAQFAARFGADAGTILTTYRSAMPGASPADLFVAVASILMMGLGSVEIAERKAAQSGAPVYLYNFGYKSEVKVPGTGYALGTPHAMDITFKFANETLPDLPEELGGSRPERLIASRHMSELWATFARSGVPAAAGVPDWPAFTLQDRATMRIDTRCEVIRDRFSAELAMWRSIGHLPAVPK